MLAGVSARRRAKRGHALKKARVHANIGKLTGTGQRRRAAGLGMRFSSGRAAREVSEDEPHILLLVLDRIFETGSAPGPMSSSVLPHSAICLAGRVFVPLRKSGRVVPGRRPVFHAVTPYCRMSLCADEPGAGSSWAEPPGLKVTCFACLKRLTQLASGGALSEM
jgi:hypothetical protein